MIRLSLPSALQKPVLVGLLYFVASAYVFGIWVWSADTRTTSFNGDQRSTLSGIIYGTAYKPYVQRVLIPVVVRSAYSIAPPAAWDSLEQKLLRVPAVQKATTRLGWETDYLSEYIIALSLSFLCLFGFPFSVRSLWATFYKTEHAVTNTIPVIALLALPPIFPTGPHYIYDFPALLFFTLGLTLLIQRKWKLYYLIFILGCLNKETMVLLTFAFALHCWKTIPVRTYVFHLAAQLLFAGICKAIIVSAFSSNPGNAMDFHLYLNVDLLLSGYGWTTFVLAMLGVWLVLYDWQQKPHALKQTALLIFPFGLLWLWGGVVTELRALYELFPIVIILGLHTVFFSILKMPYHLNRTYQHSID